MSFSIVASRTRPIVSRMTMTKNATAARTASASPRKPNSWLRANRSSIRRITPRPAAEQDQTARGAPEQRAPAETPPAPLQRIVDGNDRRLGVGLRYHLHGASGGVVLGQRRPSRRSIVEAKDRGRPMRPVVRSLQPVSDQELQRAVEANVRQRGQAAISRLQERRPQAQETKVGVLRRGRGNAAKAPASLRNSSLGSSGKSPGNIAASVSPSNVSPPAPRPQPAHR